MAGKFTDPSQVKIHTYCACKNEMKFLDRFMESIKGTDTLSIMDSGSTDGTWERLQEYAEMPEWKGRLFIAQHIIDPFRFDALRNKSMELIPDDCDYCFCIDLDELVVEGFFDRLRQIIFSCGFIPERIFYKYAWSHHNDGTPNIVFWYDKTHGPKGWKWYGACHEQLRCDPEYKSLYGRTCKIDDGSTIWLHHWPDQTKSRGSYLGLLKIRCEEDPGDLYSKYYYARELGYRGLEEEAAREWITLYFALAQNPKKDDMMMLPSVCCELANRFSKLHLDKEAEFYYKRAIDYDPTFINPRVYYAQFLAYRGRSSEAIETVSEAYKVCSPHYDWRENPALFGKWKKLQILAVAMCWLKEYGTAYAIMQQAIQDIEDHSAQEAADREYFYNDYRWVMDKELQLRKANSGQKS